MIGSNIFWEHFLTMAKRYHYLPNNQPKTQVIARCENDLARRLKLTVLTVSFAGFFYFFGSTLWLALNGG
jgi:hypothetical protein